MANPTNDTKNSFVPKEVDIKTVNLFFDGTKNNLYNTDTYKGFSTKKKKKHNEDETSYSNAYSNVAWMFYRKASSNGQFWIYMEGIGTVRGDEDDEMLGFAFGDGDTGVVERAKQAFGEIEKEVGRKPNILYINVFGFSRGAATARHFIHLAKSNPKLFKKWKLSKNQIRFKFVGLFDTVSSYQYVSLRSGLLSGLIPAIQAVNHNFDNDVAELKLDFRDLDANDKKITKVFHIIAADEYRENFSVTNIRSAINGSFGYEVVMNGAHADVGGAYPDNTKGKKYDIEEEDVTLKAWLITKGFYKTDQIKLIKRTIGSNYYQAERTNAVYYDIHKVSLNMTARMAVTYGSMNFNSALSAYYSNLRPGVRQLMGRLPDKVIKGVKWGGRLNLSLVENKTTKGFRSNYVHWSAKYVKGSATADLGFGLRRTRDGEGVPSRKIING
ncbi:T6SS phospholipase effector Tle1-like catalytic domain-containing protein [Psychrobacter sp. DAB_AL43B]|uniref:T6SS phospholipase effector Tle1-like catalytic domain-containing protein n=1 Tax=Psychrobacter sp. DAB_AL43B TaxID=1028416 RepID=UPI0009A826B3|nr:DUF2235 domain-containing protein [Psychrobacter sp. DAB_AL43B]SLJ84285.1 hypothetical protein DABAL43B_1087 [Psychrobacter sp. DAB_AL43B]